MAASLWAAGLPCAGPDAGGGVALVGGGGAVLGTGGAVVLAAVVLAADGLAAVVLDGGLEETEAGGGVDAWTEGGAVRGTKRKARTSPAASTAATAATIHHLARVVMGVNSSGAGGRR